MIVETARDYSFWFGFSSNDCRNRSENTRCDLEITRFGSEKFGFKSGFLPDDFRKLPKSLSLVRNKSDTKFALRTLSTQLPRVARLAFAEEAGGLTDTGTVTSTNV